MTLYFVVYQDGRTVGKYATWSTAFAVLDALAKIGLIAIIQREFHG